MTTSTSAQRMESRIPHVNFAITQNQSRFGVIPKRNFVTVRAATLRFLYESLTEWMEYLIQNAEVAMRPHMLKNQQKSAHSLNLLLNSLHQQFPHLLPKVHHCQQCRRQWEQRQHQHQDGAAAAASARAASSHIASDYHGDMLEFHLDF